MATPASALARRFAILAAACAALALAAIAAPATAPAAPKYGAKQICGSSYHAIDRHPLRSGGKYLGRVVLMYSRGWNCVATIKTYRQGTRHRVQALVDKQGNGKHARPQVDEGGFRYYAGPVRTYAPGRCVRWGGFITAGRAGDSYLSPYEHCG